ncbi:unnamed protein product [Parajaminaea phylloscopi]
MSTSPTAPASPTSPSKVANGRGYSAVGTISAAFASLWGSSASKDPDHASSHDAPVASSSSRAPSASTLFFPGGWTPSYFSRPPSRALHDPPSPLRSPPRGQHDEQHEGSPSEVKWRKRSSSGAGRKRTPIPFDHVPHSRQNSEATKVELPSSPRIASHPPHTASLRPPGPHETGSSVMATLTRLKAQSSMSSLRSNNALDSSFATANGSFGGKAEGGQDEWSVVDRYGGEGILTGNSSEYTAMSTPAWLSPLPHTPPEDSAPDRDSIKPGAPPPRDWREALARANLLDSYVQGIVYQSGIDSSSRPIIVLSSPALPNNSEVDYDALLERIMDKMDLFVQNDYTVVFFAGGSRYRPPWTWIWSAYRRLSRPFRKNCRRLFICHPTFFTRTLVRLVSTGSAVLSPKFARKITQVNTLSELAEHLDLSQIDIPPEVLKWNMRYEKQVSVPQAGETKGDDSEMGSNRAPQGVFGVPIDALMGERGEKGGIPRVVKDCVEELQQDANLETEGLFRKSPSSALLRAAQEAYDRGQPVSLAKYNDCHIPAVLLKLFFRSLPDAIFASSIYPIARSCPPICEDDDEAMRDVLTYLRDSLMPAIQPQSKLILLSYVLELLHKTSLRSATNKMDATNLATVWAPNLLRSSDPIRDVAMCSVAGAPKMQTHMRNAAGSGEGPGAKTAAASGPTLGTILKVCIERYYEVFEFNDMDYEPPTYDADSMAEALASPPVGITAVLASEPSAAVSPRRTRTVELASHPASPNARARHCPLALPASPARSASTSLLQGQMLRQTLRSPSSSRHGMSSSSMHSAGQSIGGGLGLGFVTSSSSYRGGLGNPTTVGRSASGSLRLTKARLGMGPLSSATAGSAASASAFSLTGPSTSFYDARVLSNPCTLAEDTARGVVGSGLTSGVALTGASATGLFAGPGSAASRPDLPSPTSEAPGQLQPAATPDSIPAASNKRGHHEASHRDDASVASSPAASSLRVLSPTPSVGSLRSARSRSASAASSLPYSSTPDKKPRGSGGGGESAGATGSRMLRKSHSRSLNRLRAAANATVGTSTATALGTAHSTGSSSTHRPAGDGGPGNAAAAANGAGGVGGLGGLSADSHPVRRPLSELREDLE